ncbi:MAG: DUF4230 domain-containing protein [Chitinophagales bacterium]|nr:DUF4230 domain-containing protein [Chitinophagales bacterium]
MNKILKYVIAVVVGILLYQSLKIFDGKKEQSQIDSTIVVEKIEKVLKMVTIEGNFSELLTYSDYDYIDFPGFRKKAIIKVDAKVMVGYDLNNIKITTDEATKTITISNLPKAQILSVDHNLSYYDMDNGLFNSFDEKDLSALNAKAKALIVEKAKSSDLLQQADEQRRELFSLIYYLAKDTGYKVVVEGKPLQDLSITTKTE